jgi:hypothetical protein
MKEPQKGFGDGSKWTISPDIDETIGVAQDLFQVEVSLEAATLKEWFTNKPLFLDVINALLELDHGMKLQERKQAQHQASQYAIEDGWLWLIGGSTRIRAWTWQECVTRVEVVELARQEDKGGHWHQD